MYILTALHSFQSLTTFEILSDLHWNAFSPCISCAPTQSLNMLGCFHFWQDKGYEDAKPVIEALNSKGVSVIGAVGFCWGGRTSLLPHCYIILIDNYHNLLMLRLMYARNHIFNEKPIELSNPDLVSWFLLSQGGSWTRKIFCFHQSCCSVSSFICHCRRHQGYEFLS